MNPRVLILGGQGYLGWSVGVGLALSNRASVVLADNDAKSSWARHAAGARINPRIGALERVAALREISERPPQTVELDAADPRALAEAIAAAAPDVILNCAHQPSAPYSELSQETAALTLENNTRSHLNVLWNLKGLRRPVKYIEMNSAGAMGDIDVDRVPAGKVSLSFSVDGGEHAIRDTWLPMQASDVYHLSKAQNFMLSEMFATRFGLAVTSVRQSVIFGLAPVDRELPRPVLPPLYYDPVFGTVVNRFVLQQAAGIRPTIYGDGGQFTGVIAMADAVDSLVRCCLTPGVPGKLEVIHNQTAVLSVKRLGAMIEGNRDWEQGKEAEAGVKRRLAPTCPGPRSRSLAEIAGQLDSFGRLARTMADELQRDKLAGVCPRADY